MSKQTETIRQLTDRLNATEAICKDLLSHIYNSEAQGQIKFDDYRFKYTQEAIERREAEAKAKQLKDNYSTAQADFKDMAKSYLWTLVFLSSKEQEKKLDDIWNTITSGLELPDDAKRPRYVLPEINEELLISRRSELLESIDKTNAIQCEDTIEHCNKSKMDFTKSMEMERDKQLAELNRKDGLSESERQRHINETQAYFNNAIKKHLLEMNRQIKSAEISLSRLESSKAELVKVNQALGKLLTQ